VTDQQTQPTHAAVLAAAGLTLDELSGGTLAVPSPIDGAEVARIAETDPADMPAVIARAQAAFAAWRRVPAPRRGELVRLFGDELRAAKAELGAVVTLEAGKVVSEGEGEVQTVADGKVHQIRPGVMYALDQNDEHYLRARTTMKMVCVFNPPLSGREVHDEHGVYPLAAAAGQGA